MNKRELLTRFLDYTYYINDKSTQYTAISAFLEEGKQTEMNWSAEYPTQPGYYWIRNYTLQRYNRQEYIPGCAIVDVDNSLNGHLDGEDPVYFRQNLLSAEWFGPITPPLEESGCGHISQENEK